MSVAATLAPITTLQRRGYGAAPGCSQRVSHERNAPRWCGGGMLPSAHGVVLVPGASAGTLTRPGSVSERPKVRHSKCRVAQATVGPNPTATADVKGS